MGGLLTWPEDGDESPFRGRLVESEHVRSPRGRLRMFEDDGRWVVRLVPALQLEAVPGLLAISRRLHDDVEALGVPLPPRLYVMGSRHRDGNPQGFVVVRTVTRCEVPGERSLPPSFAPEADRLCVALAGYYEAHYEAGGRFMPDIRLDQFVFGHLDGEVPRLWLVDLDPGFVEIDARTDDRLQLARIHWRIAEAANMVVGLESAVGRRLDAARAEIDRLVRSDMFRDPSAADRPAVLFRILAEGQLFDGGRWVQEQYAS